jgi:hypothetical protein
MIGRPCRRKQRRRVVARHHLGDSAGGGVFALRHWLRIIGRGLLQESADAV